MRKAVIGISIALFLGAIAFVALSPAPTMPVFVGEEEVAVLKDPIVEGCSPHRGILSQDGQFCVLHEVLKPGWHEVDTSRYEVEVVYTGVQTWEFK